MCFQMWDCMLLDIDLGMLLVLELPHEFIMFVLVLIDNINIYSKGHIIEM